VGLSQGETIAEYRAHPIVRIAAFVAGLAILIGAAIVSIGAALCAPIGVWLFTRFQRSRGRRFDAFGSWMSAAGAVAIGLILVACVIATQVPPGTMSRIRQASDSASAQAAKQPPPAWLDRFVPGGAARYSASKQSAAYTNAATMIFGFAILACVLGSIIGSLGWIASMLLMFSTSGRWLGASPSVAIESDRP
jgi:hypothetical protein